MKKTKYRKYLIIATVVVALSFIVEGCVYYGAVDNLFFKFSLNFQNVIKAYKLDSDISQADAIKFLDENPNSFDLILWVLDEKTYIVYKEKYEKLIKE